MALTHTHNRECFAGNELDELCCSDPSFMDDAARLAAADRWRVQTLRCTINVFTDSADDAKALAFAYTGSRPLSAVASPQEWPS